MQTTGDSGLQDQPLLQLIMVITKPYELQKEFTVPNFRSRLPFTNDKSRVNDENGVQMQGTSNTK